MSQPFVANAAAVRRQVGPVAWCALECLVERSSDGVAETSVRAVAAELGVAKNTAHRAIATLVRAGLVEPEQRRDGAGRFRPGRYRLRVHEPPTATAPTRRPSPRSTARLDSGQLSLLGD